MQLKTLMEHYNQQMACDLLRDWSDVYLASLTQAIFDAFTIGDSVQGDVSQALDDFKVLIMDKFVPQAEDVDLCGYLADNSISYTPGLSAMQNGSGSGYYGYMSRPNDLEQKAGKPISAANQKIIDDHVKAMKAMAKQAKSDMQSHVDSMNDAVDSMSGSSSDSGKSLGTLAQKAGRPLSAANANALHDMADKAMSIMQDHTKALSKAANGLADAVTPPVSDTDGEDPTDDQDEQVEKSLQDALLELKALSA